MGFWSKVKSEFKEDLEEDVSSLKNAISEDSIYIKEKGLGNYLKEFANDLLGTPSDTSNQTNTKPTAYCVRLESCGNDVRRVLKVVREVTGLDIQKAQQLVEKVPVEILHGVSITRADYAIKKLTEAGAAVTLK